MKCVKTKGFTLIELLIVLAIIGILAAIMIPNFNGFNQYAAETAVKSDAKCILTAYDAYSEDNQKTPKNIEELIPYLSVSILDGESNKNTISLILDENSLGGNKFVYAKSFGKVKWTATCTRANKIIVSKE